MTNPPAYVPQSGLTDGQLMDVLAMLGVAVKPAEMAQRISQLDARAQRATLLGMLQGILDIISAQDITGHQGQADQGSARECVAAFSAGLAATYMLAAEGPKNKESMTRDLVTIKAQSITRDAHVLAAGLNQHTALARLSVDALKLSAAALAACDLKAYPLDEVSPRVLANLADVQLPGIKAAIDDAYTLARYELHEASEEGK